MEKKSARNQTVRQPQPPHIKKRPVGGSAVSGPSFGALVLEAGAMHCGSVGPGGSMKVGGPTRAKKWGASNGGAWFYALGILVGFSKFLACIAPWICLHGSP